MSNHTKKTSAVGRLEELERYYERMRSDARTALEIAERMSLEMDEQLSEVRRKLERARAKAASVAIRRKLAVRQDSVRQAFVRKVL